MSRVTAVLVAAALCLPVHTHAQSTGDFAGFFGLIFTPVGAFTPVASGKPNADARSSGVQFRVSKWQFAPDDDNTTNLGAGYVFTRGRARTAIEIGYVTNEQCDDCGLFMAGADVQYDLAQTTTSGATFVAALNPAIGVGIPREGGGNAMSAALSLPLSASINAGQKLRIIPFVSPGFGFGRLSGGGDAETGSRAMLAGGVSLGGQTSSMLLTAGARKIFLEGAPTIYGIGLVIAR
jgi:hypothetical protein